MNWTTRHVNRTVCDATDTCDHLKVGDVAPMTVGEDDSCGPVGRYAMCDKCWAEYKENEDNELVYCHDCGQQHPRKNTQQWKWYDFYAPQGDEPLTICDDCSVLPKHKQRVAKDTADMQAEMGWDYDEE